MRIGITLLTDTDWSTAQQQWRAVEEYGFDHAWTYDHLRWGGLPDGPWRGGLPTLAAAAAITTRIKLGTLVASPNFRHPYLLFRDAQAVADIAAGRFLLGVGTGGELDSRIVAGPSLSVKERVERFYEFVEVLRSLRGHDDASGALTQQGRHFGVVEATTTPGLPGVPLLVAANGPRSVRFAARAGDGWITTGPPIGEYEGWLAGLGESARRFDDALAAAGREADDVRRYVNTDSTPHLQAGGSVRFALSSVGFFDDLVGRLAEFGFTDLITHWPREDQPYAGSVDMLEQVAGRLSRAPE